ncbi:23S rRNA (adenine(2503)-C(2))-methyltransferase RlmN [Bullifex sp.]|uniref:23S rRNA (adenine(2503)-C(2))-methyltransferase RlmN n=1 Tax=Bullifex sp. TaxID=2815808 RepID=UPI002A827D04|nr:23S rRNA (adenine(2503)-C(2))-methyltransferase RlmN [Bullifex sp.]MDY4066277.1 23S rRNA (adenine(2503)-C(2))-methyltransferase RlmN [Bullifex sp.]
MKSLYAKSPAELEKILKLEKSYQAKQIYSWLIKGVTDYDKMTNIPKKVRDDLKEHFPKAISSKIVKVQKADSATKLLIELYDESLIECVMLTDGDNRKTACISSQVGCAMGCSFCKTGTMGLVRNLEDFEIVEQMVHLRTLAEDITHIVFMGMGEPLHNFGPLMSAISEFHRSEGYNISMRRMTISTSGLVPGINKLTELNLGIRLAVSLVSANNELRSNIMKVNRSYPLPELKKALISFQHTMGKRITLEYCMLSGVNTTKESAKELSQFTKGLMCVVNLIPWNPIDELEYESPTESEIRAFTRELDSLNVSYTLRMTKGRSISGACGQLATSTRR